MSLAKVYIPDNLRIKVVAIYLRKSRGESDADLDKHRMFLVKICEAHGWRYREYAEIANSEFISMRPVFQKLLSDIEKGMYDAVLAMDIDRLGRGSDTEFGHIKDTCVKSMTLIITTDKIYDLSNESDNFMYDVKGVFARQEYRTIKKRLYQGKVGGAEQGNWVNGRPPFPYEYQEWLEYTPDGQLVERHFNEKGLVVNKQKLIVYNQIKTMALEGMPPAEIAWELNKQYIPSPRGKKWNPEVIRRLLIDKTHLGWIIYNKTEGDGHRVKKPNSKPLRRLPESEWITVKGCHEPVITEEEYNLINQLLDSRKIVSCRARAGTFPLSGLIKCTKCGATMSFQKSGNSTQVKSCWKRDPFGNKCETKGFRIDKIYDIIHTELLKRRDYLVKQIEKNESGANPQKNHQLITKMLDEKYAERDKYYKALKNARMNFDMGDYTREEYEDSKKTWQEKIDKVEDEIEALDRELSVKESITDQERVYHLNYVLNTLETETNPKDKNELYKLVIKSIDWTFNEGMKYPKLKVNFL